MALRAGTVFHGTVGQPTAQVIDGSLKFDDGLSQYLNRTPSSSGNLTSWTFSFWIKLNKVDGQRQILSNYVDSSNDSLIKINSNGYLEIWNYRSGAYKTQYISNARFRDTSGWYNFVISCNGSTSLSVWANGVALTFSTSNGPDGTDWLFNGTNSHQIGRYNTTANSDFQLTQVNWIDGQALGPEYFGFTDPLTNTWRPKKFNQFTDPIATQYSGASTLTWDDSPIGSIYTLSNGNKTATAGGGGSGYPNADVWSIAIPADSTYAWTLDITNGDSTGGWYFTDSQTASGTHADERGGNSLGMRPGETHAGYHGTFATANGGSSGQDKISMPGASPGPGFARVDFVVYRPASGTGKVWVKNNGSSSWVGGGDPSNTSSTPSFIIPDGTTYFGLTFYDRSTADQIATFEGDGSIQQKTGGNSFYLPMDGNSPIGQDKSGKGNDYTPVNFGGSVALDNPQVSGAKPILNTTQGGTQATVGVFGSRNNVGYAVTVYDDGGGNKYYIDGVKQATLNGLIRGATYTFDTSDSTLGSTHPFRLSATSAHGTEYTNGVAAITGAATTITIPYDAPESLYYYCTAHSGMGSSITGITTNEKLADQYASNCVLALPLIGVSTDVSASIACTMTNNSVTSNGDAAASSDKSNFYAGSFEFDGTGDYLNLDIGSGGLGSGDFTIEFWSNSDTTSGQRGQFQLSPTSGGLAGATTALSVYQNGTGFYRMYVNDTASADSIVPNDLNKWNHFAVVRSGSTQKMYVNGIESLSASSTIDYTTARYLCIGGYYSTSYLWDGYIQDFRIYKGVAKYTSNFVVSSPSPDILPDTPSGVSGSSKLTKITDGAVTFDGTGDYLSLIDNNDFNISTGDWTIEGFLYAKSPSTTSVFLNKRSNGSTYQWIAVALVSGQFSVYATSNGSSWDIISGTPFGTAVANKWHHWAIVRNGNTFTGYLDGVGKVLATSSSSISKDTADLHIGSDTDGTSFSGFLSNVRIIKGTALYTKNFTPPFAPLTNVTNTILLCCQSNISAITAAVSPVTITTTGNAAATTFNPFNTDINTVRGQETGYATLNPLNNITEATFADGNLKVTTKNAASHYGTHTSTLSMSSGKHYAEVTVESTQGYPAFGVCDVESAFTDTSWIGGLNPAISYYGNNGKKYVNGASAATYGSSFGAGNTIGIAVDLDNLTVEFFKDGVSQGVITGLTDDTEYFFGGSEFDAGSGVFLWNYGQKPFKFAPPDGFQPLNTANLRPVKVISRPDQFVGLTTYTGSVSPQTVGGINFTSDLIWIKSRTHTGWNILQDSVRGFGKILFSNHTNAEVGNANDLISDVSSTGFSVNTNYAGGTDTATTTTSGTNSYVGWCWKAGGNKNTFNVDDVGYASAAAAGITEGTNALTGASVGTKQGFSITKHAVSGASVPYTVGHGLSEAPTFIVWKSLSSSNWVVYHASTGNQSRTYLNLTNTASSGEAYLNNTSPSSTVITMGSSGEFTGDMIIYSWHDVPGLQKFGSYIGNGTADDGSFVELGFRPAIILIKRTTSGSGGFNWTINDSERGKYNPNGTALFPNLANIESTNDEYEIDFLSNGFKLRSTTPDSTNVSGQTYIYAAWAEAPTIDLYGGGANAR